MSLHRSLPVYKASYDLFIYSFQLIKDLNKEYKYTAGEKVKNEVMDLMMNIYRANKSRTKRKERIEKARENIEVIRILFRLLKDLKQISIKHFSRVNLKIEEISKQLSGWQRSTT
ncbi:MAG: four helix bundle protein [Candidatus Paceibacterota bacterium]